MSTFGTFEQNGQTITGTANKVTEYTQFSSDPNEQEGYYYAFNIEPWEGVTYSSAKHPEPKPLKDDGHLIVFLGKEAPEKKYVDFHYTDGSTVRYWIDVTAAAGVSYAQRQSTPIMATPQTLKSTKRTTKRKPKES